MCAGVEDVQKELKSLRVKRKPIKSAAKHHTKLVNKILTEKEKQGWTRAETIAKLRERAVSEKTISEVQKRINKS